MPVKDEVYRMNICTWDERFIGLAKHISEWSKDPSTKVGAVAVSEDSHQILSTGWNGFPRKIGDTHDRLLDRNIKYKLTVHAEMNCIYNATHNGISLNLSRLYVYGLPVCSSCALGVLQVGVSKVIMRAPVIGDLWKDEWKKSSKLFDEAGIEYYFI